MKPEIWVPAISIFASTMIALVVGDRLQRWHERRDRKRELYKTLMTSRAARLDLEHVRALNQVEIEFNGLWRKHGAVRKARLKYVQYLTQHKLDTEDEQNRAQDLLDDLLGAMGRVLGYNFSADYLRNGAYFPRGYWEAFADQLAIRQGMAKVMRGQALFPVGAVIAPAPPEAPPTVPAPESPQSEELPDGAFEVGTNLGQGESPK